MVFADKKNRDVSATELVSRILSRALARGQSFSLWKMSGKKETFLILADSVKYLDDINLEGSETGFAFAPFDPARKKIFVPADMLYQIENGVLSPRPPAEILHDPIPRELAFYQKPKRDESTPNFQQLVQESITAIELGQFEKVVPSRFKDIAVDKLNLVDAFEKLCAKHPQALVSLVSSPETGTWLGASPELLVSVTQSKFKTVALAGTLPYSQDINLKSVAWTQKEIEEQALVCRFIINCFKKIRLREYEEHGPKTTVAGNVMHLKTEYEVDMLATNFPQLGSVMLKLLHPTSAVCGMPMESSIDFLKKQEGYQREYYSGYLGPVNLKTESHLYVNLRCLQWFSDQVRLYAGAGVTADSIADQEWSETEMKMDNLRNILIQ